MCSFNNQNYSRQINGQLNRLILNLNQDLVPVVLGWLSFSVRVLLFKGCRGGFAFPSLLHFGHTLAQRQPGAHTFPRRALTGELSSCNHNHHMPLQGQPGRRAPPKCRPAPTQSRPGRGADTQEPGRVPGLRLSAGERGARRPTPTPPRLWAHNRAHTPARAHRHTRAHAQRGRATDGSVGGGPEWFGARSRVPREGSAGRPAPPRPSNPPSRARLGLQSFAASPPRQRAGLGSARLCVAPDGRDRWPYRAPGCAPSSAPRGSRHPAPPPAGAARAPSRRRVCSQPPVRPRSPSSSSSPAPTPSPPPPIMARGPARTSPGPGSQLLPLLPLLLLLLQDAGGSHTAPARSAPPAAADGLAGYKNPQRSPGDAAAALGPGTQDMVAVHMLRLYEKYSRRGARPGGGNTVRSFRARLGK